jgi:hypothetical protein
LRGILFPANEPLPRFVWIEYDDKSDFASIAYKPFLGTVMLDHISHDGCPNLKRVPAHRLGIYYKDNYMNEDLPTTPSLTKWLGPALDHFFRGPFLAHGYKNDKKYDDGDESEEGKPCDMDTSVLKVLLESFQVQGALYYKRKASGGQPVTATSLPDVFKSFATYGFFTLSLCVVAAAEFSAQGRRILILVGTTV